MIHNILVAIDGSESSQHALDQAIALARSEEGSLILTTVVPSYNGDLHFLGRSNVLDTLKQSHVKMLEQAEARAVERGARVKETVLAQGEPYEEVLALADETGADLLVLGKKGHYAADRIPLGSVAARVLSLSRIDVLVTPGDCSFDPATILLVSEGSADLGRAAEQAVDLAARYGSRLLLLNVYDLPLEGFALSPESSEEVQRKGAAQLAATAGLAEAKGVRRVEKIVRIGPPAKVATEVAREYKAGIIVMGSRGEGELKKLFSGSVVERTISMGACPVWVARQ